MRLIRTMRAAGMIAALVPALVAAQPQVVHDSLTIGGRVIEAGTTVDGPIVVAGGDLEVRGTVNGNAVVIAGDVNVVDGGQITGDAIAAFGDVRGDGRIGGKALSLTGLLGATLRSALGPDVDPVPSRTPLQLAAGWFFVMLLLAFLVSSFAGSYVEGVVDVLELSFWRSFLTGIAGQLGVLPVILLACVALAITVIGALLIPFAIVAIVLGTIGLAALGFVAVGRVTGSAVDRGSTHGSPLRGVLVGTVLLMGLWLIAALVAGIPTVGGLVRGLATIVTWVAATTGFGAALLSRAGTRRDAGAVQVPAAPDVSWQTPTPVSGVAAARRPVKTGTTTR